MGKFKVGDRVRRVRDCPWPEDYGYAGREYTVLEVDEFDEIVVIPGRGGASARDFELIPPTAQAVSGAIRTVTRREIVPCSIKLPNGTSMSIDEEDNEVSIHLDDFWLDAESLREAARLFNQIAEVLEENMKEAA